MHLIVTSVNKNSIRRQSNYIQNKINQRYWRT